VIEKEPNKPSTRGILEYKDTTFGRTVPHSLASKSLYFTFTVEFTLRDLLAKNFKYTTPVLAIQDSSIANTALLGSKVFHYLHTPDDIKPRIESLLALRQKSGILDRPLIIWEPAPPSCKPPNLQTCLEAAALVDILSPNHLELAAFFAEPVLSSPSASEFIASTSEVEDHKNKIEELTSKFLENGIGRNGNGIILVRAGEHGCLVRSRTLAPRWIPPFYGSEPRRQPASVVDPTGAGNAFLGAFAVGYLKTGSVVEAACYGSVGASFALEQVGMPEKSDEGGEELWNGVSVCLRLEEYMSQNKIDLR
jgi:sugar/nucleoside kinase (ribokinase family)